MKRIAYTASRGWCRAYQPVVMTKQARKYDHELVRVERAMFRALAKVTRK